MHEELRDWEQEDYVRFTLDHLASLSKEHQVPIALTVDMAKWWRTHPLLAQMTYQETGNHWTIKQSQDVWRVRNERTNDVVTSALHRNVTLLDFMEEESTTTVPYHAVRQMVPV